jgi:transposase InsO family protein
MPWNESTWMDERRRFVEAYLTGQFSMTELCRSAGVSRPTGYLWVERYRLQGEAGLADRSHAPHRCPHRTPEAVARQLLALRRRHPHWGPRKLLRVASRRWPQLPLPSRSAAAAILRRAGLVAERRRRAPPIERPAQAARVPATPNVLWTIDFKGQFRTGDHRWCYPLTVADAASRYLLECHGQLRPTAAPVLQRLRRLFREQGLPESIHSDNGAPFASTGIAGLSRVSLEWLKLGIHIERSRPGCPQDNASHERMHQTLKQATARPPAAHLAAQQRRFDRFRREFNHERPHEALADRTPIELYVPSPRGYPERLPEPHYPGHFDRRRISNAGELRWHGRHLFFGVIFAHELVGLEEIDDGVWSVYFAHHLLARFDEQMGRLIEVPV